MRKKISQREARLARQRIAQLTEEVRRLRNPHSSCEGEHLLSINVGDVTGAAARTATRLGHALKALLVDNKLEIYGLRSS